MAYYIRQLKDMEGNSIFPATRASAVFFDDNTKVQDLISETPGVVKKAQADKNGKDVTEYIAGASIEDHKITLTKGDGTPIEITVPDKDTTYEEATQSQAGLMSAADKTKLDGLETSLAGKADAEHTHEMADITDLTTMGAASGEAGGKAGLVPAPAMGDQDKFLTGAGTWSAVSLTSFGITASVDELNYMAGVTSSVQTQLDGKAASEHTHEITGVNGLQDALNLKADKSQLPTVMLTTVDGWGGETTALPEQFETA